MMKFITAGIFVDKISENIDNALILMAAGMLGIFVVMGILLGAIVLLNKATKDTDGQSE